MCRAHLFFLLKLGALQAVVKLLTGMDGAKTVFSLKTVTGSLKADSEGLEPPEPGQMDSSFHCCDHYFGVRPLWES